MAASFGGIVSTLREHPSKLIRSSTRFLTKTDILRKKFSEEPLSNTTPRQVLSTTLLDLNKATLPYQLTRKTRLKSPDVSVMNLESITVQYTPCGVTQLT
jgi:LysM repeat protein